MMRNINCKKDEAVSPVVGVMLMLVVTIIIAALVSAFSGGMASTQKASPSVVVDATYSQIGGMTITHAGGDPIAISEVNFRTVPSELFGADAVKFAWVFPKDILKSGNNEVVNSTSGFFYKAAFVSGDVLTIDQADCDDYASDAELTGYSSSNPYELGDVNYNAQIFWAGSGASNLGSKESYFRAYQFGNPANIGKYFYLDLLDPTGNIITRTKVPITA